MIGMDRTTGRRLTRADHIKQSVEVICTTRLNSRVMRRDFGSDAPDLLDQPGNGEAVLSRYVAIAGALDAWEPRVALSGFTLTSMSPDGQASIEVTVTDRATGQAYAVGVVV